MCAVQECYVYGVLLSLLGSSIQSMGYTLWKLHHLKEDQRMQKELLADPSSAGQRAASAEGKGGWLRGGEEAGDGAGPQVGHAMRGMRGAVSDDLFAGSFSCYYYRAVTTIELLLLQSCYYYRAVTTPELLLLWISANRFSCYYYRSNRSSH